jgi:3',5'-cyclic-nucleotide phosphodiesterase
MSTPWPLDHGGVQSTAFLIESGSTAALCLGDHGPDTATQANPCPVAGRRPTLRAGHLRAIITEVSYPDPREDRQLFGHMTPSRLIAALRDLARVAGGAETLRGSM